MPPDAHAMLHKNCNFQYDVYAKATRWPRDGYTTSVGETDAVPMLSRWYHVFNWYKVFIIIIIVVIIIPHLYIPFII